MNESDCPNCITPWKCNGPHLTKMSEMHYSTEYGYYLLENKKWFFIAFERHLDEDELMHITDTLRYLNSTIS